MRIQSRIFTTLLLSLLLLLAAQSAQAQCSADAGPFNVPENMRDVDTGVNVEVGDTVVFNASGRIWAGVWFTGENGPAGWDNQQLAPISGYYPLPGGRIYSLVGRIDRGPAFYIGEGTRVTMRTRGRLFLRINDDVPGNGSGRFTCWIRIERGGAPLPSNFNGTGTLRLHHPSTPNPFTQNLSLPMEFSRDRCNVRIVYFPPIRETFWTPFGPNTTTISMIGGGTGTFNRATGDIEIPITLRFSHTIFFAGPSTCDLRLRTNVGGGRRLEMGRATLFGSCRCAGGFMHGTNADFTVQGSFSPGP